MRPNCPRRLLIALVALVAPLVAAPLAQAAPGDLDPTFGNGGMVVNGPGARANGLALQTDGKLIVAGSQGGNWAISRFNADGTLDDSFASNGVQTLAVGGGATATAVALQPDGKIVVAGSAQVGGRLEFGVARLNADGSPDTTFSGDGVQTTDFGVDAGTVAVGLQPDGKIVAVGSTEGSNGDVALARYNSDGSLDTSFGSSGTQTTDLGGDNDTATGLAIQPDGKIVVCAYPGVTLRYTTNGSLDSTFSDDGIQTTGFASYYNNFPDSTLQPQDAVRQPDGKIIVVGWLDNALTDDPLSTGDQSYGIVRYNTDGSLDTTFSHDGKQAIGFLFGPSIGDGDLPLPRAVALAADGRLVIGGSVDASPNTDFGLIRVNPNGQLDLSFANNGRLLTSFAQPFASAEAVAIQPDGKIVAAGYTADMDNNGNQINQHLAIARYEGGGPPPGPQPPRNITAPKISGTPTVGDFLMSGSGFWLGDTPLNYDYQWLRDGTPIPADEGGTTADFYFVASADQGHQLAVQVRATNESGSGSVTTAAVAVAPAMGGALAPTNTSLPQITGSPVVGSTLSASTGAWSGDQPQSYTYAWLRDGGAIAGATSSSYVVDAADQGHQLAVQVTASNLTGNASATSPAVSVPAPAPSGGGGQPPAGGQPPSGGGGGGGQPTAPSAPIASAASIRSVRASSGTVVVQVRCSQGSGCPAITAQLSVVEHLRGSKITGVTAAKKRITKRTAVIGKASTSLTAGQSKRLTVRLNRTGRMLLKRFKRLSGRLRVTSGAKVLKTRAVRLR